MDIIIIMPFILPITIIIIIIIIGLLLCLLLCICLCILWCPLCHMHNKMPSRSHNNGHRITPQFVDLKSLASISSINNFLWLSKPSSSSSKWGVSIWIHFSLIAFFNFMFLLPNWPQFSSFRPALPFWNFKLWFCILVLRRHKTAFKWVLETP